MTCGGPFFADSRQRPRATGSMFTRESLVIDLLNKIHLEKESILQEHLMSNERKIQLIRAALESEYGYVTSSQRPILLEGRNDRVRPKN